MGHTEHSASCPKCDMKFLVSITYLASLISFSSCSNITCPYGWKDATFVDDLGCVLLIRLQLNWDEAAAACWMNNESHLVNIHTDYQRTYLGQVIYLEDIPHHYWWVGATDRNSEGLWRWSNSGEELEVSGWREGQPNGEILENCAVQSGNDYHWDDCQCTDEMYNGLPIYAICQIN